MKSGLFAAFVADVRAGVLVVEDDVKAAWSAVKDEAIADLDALVESLKASAVKGAQEVEQAVVDGALQSSEKRSALTTKLESQAQAAGYSLEQQGISAAINFAVEFGANFVKLLVGSAVGAPANKPAQ